MKVFLYYIPRLAICCLLFLTATVSRAQDIESATILHVQGSVQITRPSSKVRSGTIFAPAINDYLFSGDVIKTDRGGRMVLKLRDGSQAIISENTVVEIKDTASSPRTVFNVLKGKTRVKIEKLGGKPNPYRVTTPTTVIAVRGTIFDVFVKGGKTSVYVVEGEVSVTSLADQRETILEPGHFVQVKKNSLPAPSRVFKIERNDRYFTVDSRLDENSHFPPKNVSPKRKVRSNEEEEPKPKKTKNDDNKRESKTVKPPEA